MCLLPNLIDVINDLCQRGVGIRSLENGVIDTTPAQGPQVHVTAAPAARPG